VTTTATSKIEMPDFANPATYVPGVPHEAFDVLRQQPELYWQPVDFGTYNGGYWVTTRFKDIVEIEKQPEVFSSVPGAFFPLANQSLDGPMSKHILFMDPPTHTRVRRVAARSFSPRVVAKFDTWVQGVVSEAVEDALALGEFDWIEAVARLVPARVIADVMGVPHEQRGEVVRWSEAVFKSQANPEDDGAAMTQAFQEVAQYMTVLGQEKLRNPQDDMVTILAQYLDRGEIDHAEYTMYLTALILAGYETTHTLLGQSMRLILENEFVHRECRAAVAAGTTNQMIDEFLRYISPIMNVMRTATKDVEFNGQLIRKNDSLQLMLTAGNRDPEAFSDPHTFNPSRDGAKPLAFGGDGLAFGSGIHRCIGNTLAKMEARILLEELDRREVRLELNGEPKRGWSSLINQLLALPVRLAPN
jgi:cytochrome P450